MAMSDQFLPLDLCEDLICCVICYEPFTDKRKPKALPCLHTYCVECLKGSIDAHRKATTKSKNRICGQFPCPVCKEVIKIPENGLDGFKDDFRVRRISEVLAQSRETRAPSPREGASADVSLADIAETDSSPSNDKRCDICKFFEKDTEADQYCLECLKIMCASCSEKHLNTSITNDHTLVSAAFKLPTESTCPKHVTEILKYFCQQCREPLCMACTMGAAHVDHDVVKLIEETSLMKQESAEISGACQAKLPVLEGRLSEFDELEKKLQSKEKSAMKAILARTMDDILKIRAKQNKMEKELEDICRDKYQALKESRHTLQEKVVTMKDMCELVDKVSQHGQDVQLMAISTDLLPELKSMTVSSKEGDSQVPEEESFIDLGKYEGLVSSDLDNSRGKEEWKSSILSEIRSVVSQMRMISTGPAESRVQLVKKIGRKGSEDGEFHFPAGAVCLRDGGIAIADMHNHRIQVFNHDGSFRTKFGGGKFKPCGIALTKEGNIAVTDCGADDLGLKIYTPDGEKKGMIGQGVFEYPFSVAVDSRGRFIVCDPATNKVTVLQPDGDVYRRFSTRTRYAFYLAVNHRDEILISDWFNHCIRIFDSKGHLLRKVGSKGYADGQLMIPLGLCSDRLGNIMVLDCKCGRVSMFGPDGKFVKQLVGPNDGIEHSRAITLTREGLLVITSGDNRREIPNEVKFYQL